GLAILAPFFSRDLGLSAVHIGILTTCFFLAGAIISPISGAIVDAVGALRVLFALFFLSSVAMVTFAAAQNLAWLVVAALVGGVATALGNPTTNALISDQVGHGRRGIAVGFKQSGVPAGSLLASALLPPVALLVDWRLAILIGAVMAIVGVVGTFRLRSPARSPRCTARRIPDRGHAVMIRQTGVHRLAMYVFFTGAAVSTVQTYIVLFGVDRAGLSEAVAGLSLGVVGLIGMLSRIALPHIAERFGQPRRFLRIVSAGALVSILVVAGGEWVPALLFIGAAGVGLTGVTANALANLMVVSYLPLRFAGRASGIVQLGFYLGFVAMPPVFGWLVDTHGSYTTGWLLATAACAGGMLTTIGWNPVRSAAAR
ncbi:MAG: MFS transporter, partial [Pseudonocardiaceae bacterium]|nr:MFS transporter [Pseudonocardiaceae bacterium]